jgi:hypothetical protein
MMWRQKRVELQEPLNPSEVEGKETVVVVVDERMKSAQMSSAGMMRCLTLDEAQMHNRWLLLHKHQELRGQSDSRLLQRTD